MSRDISELHSEYFQDLTENDYYKKLQKQLKDKYKQNQTQEKGKHQEASSAQASQKVTEKEAAKKAAVVSRLSHTKDKAQISSFQWERNENGEFKLQSEAEPQASTNVGMQDGKKIRRLLGIKIDISEKLEDIQEQFMQSVLQARSHNFFLSKFASFKSGVLGQLLSVLGLTPKEIEQLKKQAIEGGIEENIRLMEENIYNKELTELVHGVSKKTRKARRMFDEVQTQLLKQMHLLGKEDHWSQIRLYETQIMQCNRILGEFLDEKKALEYQLNMRGQEIALEEDKQKYIKKDD